MTPAPPYTERPQPLPSAPPASRRTPGMSFFMLCILAMQIATVVLLALCVEALLGIRKSMKSGMSTLVRNSYQTPLATPLLVRLDTNADQIPLQVEVYGIPNVRVVEDEPPVETALVESGTGIGTLVDVPEETGTVLPAETEVLEDVPSETGVVDEVPPEETGGALVG